MPTTEDLSPSLKALLTCRLIPLDKNTGLRSTGIGVVLRRIASKVVVSLIREDIISAVGLLQICVRYKKISRFVTRKLGMNS